MVEIVGGIYCIKIGDIMSTTIRISRETKKLLEDTGHKGQTFDDLVHNGAVELFNKSKYHIINVPMSSKNGIVYIEVRVPKSLTSLNIDCDELSDCIGSLCEDNNIEILDDNEVPPF